MYLDRNITRYFYNVCTKFSAVLITGPRQSGKSTFLQHVMKNTAYVTFDDPLNREFAIHDPNGFLDQFNKAPVILDEIQYVPEILQHIKIRIDKNRTPGTWIMTGSQQFHLMKNISETLAGRIAIFELAPFSFSEIKETLSVSLEDIIWTGLFPEPACYSEKRDVWLRSYLQTYLERDVRQLEAMKSFRAFELFVNLSAAYHSQEFHAADLARECGVSQPTIQSWRRVLEASYIGISLQPFYKNYGKRLIKSSKFYYFDSAIVCYLTRQPSMQSALSGSMGGALFEGFIVSEVWKSFYNRGKRPSAYFWRSQGGLEVDLLIEAKGKLWPVEIKLTSTPMIKHTNSLNRFKKIAGADAVGQGIIVCRINKKKSLPGNNVALPWNEFSEHLNKIVE
jgi:predicted AAA+ superfamily ATPase